MNVQKSQERTDEILDLAKKLISFKSTEKNKQGLKECADFVADYFKGTSFSVERFECKEIPSVVITKNTKTPTVFLYAHLDVVDAEETQYNAYIEDGKLYGRGSMDMKTPLAIFMVLMKELEKTGHDVGLMVVGDEERGGFRSTEQVLNAGYDCKVVLMPDGGEKVGRIVRKEKGLTRLMFKAKGKSSHGSKVWKGKNAIDFLYSTLQEIKTLFLPIEDHPEDHWAATMNIGLFNGGTDYNKVPKYATAEVDVRFTEKENSKELVEQIRSMLPEGVTMEEQFMACGYVLPEDSEFVKTFIETLGEVGRIHEYYDTHGSSDAKFFYKRHIPVIMTQPDGLNLHGPDEWVDINSVEDYDFLVRLYIERVASSSAEHVPINTEEIVGVA